MDQTESSSQPSKSHVRDQLLRKLHPLFYHSHYPSLLLKAYFTLNTGEYDFNAAARQQLMTIMRHPQSFLEALSACKYSADAIDDRLDRMSISYVFAMGETMLGTEPCAFLSDKQVFTDQDAANGQRMVDLGLITRDQGYAFGNLAACLVREEVDAAHEWQLTHASGARERMAEAHMRLSETMAACILYVFHRTPTITEAIKTNGKLEYEDLQRCYPNQLRSVRAVQLKDELFDFIIDLQSEVKSGRPSPNWFLAKLDVRGQLTDAQGEILPYLKDIAAEHPSNSFVALKDLPQPVRDVIKSSRVDYAALIEGLHPNLHSLLHAYWEKALALGCAIPDANGKFPHSAMRHSDGQIEL